MSKTKKAVFFDIDGTLWEWDRVIPKSTRKAIELLKKNGHYAFICSGRTRSFIRNKELLSLGFDGIIAGCGTYIEFADEVLFHNLIEPKLLNQTMEIFKKHNMLPILEGTKNIYVDQHTYDNETYVQMIKQEIGDDLLLIEQTRLPQICKYSVGIKGISLEVVANELNPWYDLIVHGKEVMEVIPKGYSKATGIIAVCEKLQVALEDTYAFGDSSNDIEMLQHVAHGVAMGNASEEVKKISDYVTKDVKNNGIYHGLKHFGLI